jgi:hypothetical protein
LLGCHAAASAGLLCVELLMHFGSLSSRAAHELAETTSLYKGIIGKLVPELLAKGRVRPRTFTPSSLLLELYFFASVTSFASTPSPNIWMLSPVPIPFHPQHPCVASKLPPSLPPSVSWTEIQ